MVKHLLILPDGTEISSGYGTVDAIKTIKHTDMVNAGDELILGSCCADMLEASLFTPGGSLPELTAGQEVQLYKVDDAGRRTKKGIYILESPARPSADTMKLYGYSRIIKLDKDLTKWLAGLDGWPYRLDDFCLMVCEACGVSLAEIDEIPNGGMSVYQFERPDVTGRMLLQWAGELACRFVTADPDGVISFRWYADNGITLDPGSYYQGGLSAENYDVSPIDAVQIRMTGEDTGPLWPEAAENANSYIIEDNPLFPTDYTDASLPIIQTMLEELAGASYTPCKLTLPARQDISAGDIVRVTDRNGREIKVYVMEKVTQGQKDTLRCTGSARRDSATARNNKSTRDKSAEAARGAAFRVKGALASVAEVFLEPGLEEFETLRKHILGEALIPEEDSPKYDFNSDGIVSITDLLLCRSAALGLESLAGWAGAVKTPVEVTLDATNTEKAIKVSGVNMWGRKVEYYMGFNGASLGRIIGDLAVGGLLSAGSALMLGTDTDGNPTLAFGNEAPKKLSWKDNGDGTFTPIGR